MHVNSENTKRQKHKQCDWNTNVIAVQNTIVVTGHKNLKFQDIFQDIRIYFHVYIMYQIKVSKENGT